MFLFHIVLLFALILLNAYFSAAEIAVVALKPGARRRLEQQGKTGKCLKQLLADSGKFLATIQMGVTLAGFLASAFAADTFSDPLTDFLFRIGLDCLSRNTLDALIVIVITLLISFISIIFGELLPKQIGLRYSEWLVQRIAVPMFYILKISAPVVWLLNQTVVAVMKILHIKVQNEDEVSEEEIRMLVELGNERGVIDSQEKQMINNVFELNDKQAYELMTHRREITAVSHEISPDELEKLAVSIPFSHIPVYSGNVDHIVGVLVVRDLLIARLAGKKLLVDDLMYPAFFAPETANASVLLREMRQKNKHIAILLDEYGGTAGLVSISDLVKEVVGDFVCPESARKNIGDIESTGPDTWCVDARMLVKDVFSCLNIAVIPERYQFSNMSKMLLELFNKLPAEGESFVMEKASVKFTVVEMTDRRISKVFVQKLTRDELKTEV